YQDITAPVIVPTSPELAGVNAGDTLTVSCEDILIMRANDVLVTDNCDPSPQYQFTELILGRGNCERDGYLMLMHCGWIATDACGNESRWRVYVRVIDTLAPVLSGIPSDTLVD